MESIGQDDSSIAILCSNDLYLSSENGRGPMTCSRNVARSWESFIPEGGTEEPPIEQTLVIGNFSILDDLGVSAPNVAGIVYIPSDE